MKILVVQESDWMEKGPHQSHHLLERLVELGHQIRIIDNEIEWRKRDGAGTLAERKVFDGIHKVIKEGGVTVIRPSIIRLPVVDYCSLLVTHRNEILRQVKEFKPDIIVGFGILNTLMARKIAHRQNIPFLYYLIDELHLLVPQKQLQWMAKLVESRNLVEADKIIAINEALRDFAIRLGATPSKTEVIRAGVDLKKYDGGSRERLRRSYGFSDEDTVLFFMGWLYPFSGLLEVAESLKHSKNERIKLFVLGKGELWEQLESMRTNGMEKKIVLEGWKPYDQIPGLISISDVCLLPAKKDRIMMNIVPIKLYEYLAGGKPVITTSLNGIKREFGTDGGIVFVNQPQDVLDKVEELIERGDLQEIGVKGRRFVENCDWDSLTFRFEVILKGLIEERKNNGTNT